MRIPCLKCGFVHDCKYFFIRRIRTSCPMIETSVQTVLKQLSIHAKNTTVQTS